MPLRINLASVPFGNRRPVLLLCSAVILLSGVFSVRLIGELRRLRGVSTILEAEIRTQRLQIAGLQAKIPPPVRKEQLTAEERETLQSASLLIESRLFSWSQMLREVEGAQGEGVRLTSIRVSLADASKVDLLNPGRAPLKVSLVLVGKQLPDIMGALDRLRKRGHFVQFVPRKQSVLEGTQEIEYELDATYVAS